METLYLLLGSVIIAALYFEFCNGWNDSANAIATVVATRVMRPYQALILAALLNFFGALGGQAVAKTIAHSIIQPSVYSAVTESEAQAFVLAAVLAAGAWITIVTRLGLPVSGSHSLIGGMLGAGLCLGGFAAIKGQGITLVLAGLLLSPVLGLLVGYGLMVSIVWIFRHGTALSVNRAFGKLQILSVSWMAFEHGRNDAQKTMGIITLALTAGAILLPADQMWAWQGGQWQQLESLEGLSLSDDSAIAHADELESTLVLAMTREHLQARFVTAAGDRILKDVPPQTFMGTPRVAWDAERRLFVVYGVTSHGAETWSFDGERWEPLAAGESPPPRGGAAMAFDATRRVCVLHGGMSESGQALADTWEWDGATWKERQVPGGVARHHHTMTFDPARGALVLAGGVDRDGGAVSTVLELRGDEGWVEVMPGAPSLDKLTLAPAASDGTFLAVGFEDRTPQAWQWRAGTWSKIDVETPRLRPGSTLWYQASRGVAVLYGTERGSPRIPTWVILICAVTMALGTAAGGTKVMATMGHQLTKLRPVHGFAAESGASIVLMIAASMGLPVSTTHTITASIMGAGATQRFSAVRWGVGRKLVYAWIYTFPATMIVGALIFLIARIFFLA